MDLGIEGKVALVAGGSKGMGYATARQLAANGCKVAIVARDQGGIDEAVAELRKAGWTAIGISADLATEAGALAAVDAIRSHWGPPEILIAQTNDTGAGFFFDISNDDYERVFRVFTMSVVYLARAVIPDMRARQWGRIVHIGSSAAKEPAGSIAHVLANTVRPSTVGLLKSLADEFASDNITVNTVAPGWISTGTMLQYLADEYGVSAEQADGWVKANTNIPLGRAGKPEEIGGTVAFLCSQLAGYITGEWIVVDGGQHRAAF